MASRHDIAIAIAEKCGITKAKTEEVLTAAFEEIKSTLEGGERVTFKGFGSFAPRNMSARTCTLGGKTMTLKAHKRPGFKPLFKI